MNIYVELTRKFNEGRLRAILSSGQAVVLHRLAVMSKDGDWLLREECDVFDHILKVLDSYGARYRFGAPLDMRWMVGGWSSHFEFMSGNLRVRTDFVCRPPRISPSRLESIWREQETRSFPFVDLIDLISLKKTNREKDYAVIGEIARKIIDVDDQLRYSRSARDIMELCLAFPESATRIASERPVLVNVSGDLEKLEVALDAERRKLMHENENRLQRYIKAASPWSEQWKLKEKMVEGRSLIESHNALVKNAEGCLPFDVEKQDGYSGVN